MGFWATGWCGRGFPASLLSFCSEECYDDIIKSGGYMPETSTEREYSNKRRLEKFLELMFPGFREWMNHREMFDQVQRVVRAKKHLRDYRKRQRVRCEERNEHVRGKYLRPTTYVGGTRFHTYNASVYECKECKSEFVTDGSRGSPSSSE
jgi:hypothetical protein